MINFILHYAPLWLFKVIIERAAEYILAEKMAADFLYKFEPKAISGRLNR